MVNDKNAPQNTVETYKQRYAQMILDEDPFSGGFILEADAPLEEASVKLDLAAALEVGFIYSSQRGDYIEAIGELTEGEVVTLLDLIKGSFRRQKTFLSEGRIGVMPTSRTLETDLLDLMFDSYVEVCRPLFDSPPIGSPKEKVLFRITSMLRESLIIENQRLLRYQGLPYLNGIDLVGYREAFDSLSAISTKIKMFERSIPHPVDYS